MVKRVFSSLIFGLFLFTACEQSEGDELTLDDLQKAAIDEQNKYSFRARVDVFSFNTNNIDRRAAQDSLLEYVANRKDEDIRIQLNTFRNGSYSSLTNRKAFIEFWRKDGVAFYSTMEGVESDAILMITEVDSNLREFSGTFSGTLYDRRTDSPQSNEAQVSVEGSFNGFSF